MSGYGMVACAKRTLALLAPSKIDGHRAFFRPCGLFPDDEKRHEQDSRDGGAQGQAEPISARDKITNCGAGRPDRVSSAVVGAVGVAGLSKETDAEITNTAAAALNSSPMRA
jgi:Haem-degrading